ncbi:acyltransferase [Anaerobium acetethylicum]|uniref:Acetyltransferase (Isoleucine patch superfamily) n=1 Tax=Anaerobium acetethylicum TaxID=1619234 RepID=A0A1D3TYX1_9FIRM|nr:acyltransferase [Anaerobium acetethylicum]SCP99688.1 Acetyltransferase (isoleucine patch superfamily) [Anaerobium acetethylicum]
MAGQKLRAYLKNNRGLLKFCMHQYNSFASYKFKAGKDNYLDVGAALLKNSSLKIKGKNNRIVIGDLSRVVDCRIEITGNDNVIHLGDKVNINKTIINIAGDKNEFRMDRYSSTNANVEFGIMDGTKLLIGEDCMISRNTQFWTGDYHAILNTEGRRINPSEDVTIGNHVWIGTGTSVLKGAVVPDNSIVGASSLVTKKFSEENIIIAGNPARAVKSGVNWTWENIQNQGSQDIV